MQSHLSGASRVSLIDIDVTNGSIGIVARNGAHVNLSGVNVHVTPVTGYCFKPPPAAFFPMCLHTGMERESLPMTESVSGSWGLR